MEQVTLLIVDDHPIVRTGVRSLLRRQPHVDVVAEAGAADEAYELVCKLRPKVVLLDLRLPGGGALRLIRRMREESFAPKVVVFTAHDDPVLVRAAFAAGANGYLVKGASGAVLMEAIARVNGGGIFLDESIRELGPDFLDEFGVDRTSELSDRELQVLRLIASGFTNREAADYLGVGEKSVETYRARVTQKLGAATRTDLVRHALRLGLIESEG